MIAINHVWENGVRNNIPMDIMNNSVDISNQSTGRAYLQLGMENAHLVKSLSTPNGKVFIAWSLVYIALWMILMLGLYFSKENWFIQFILSILIASQLHTFTILQHDCGHKAAFQSDLANLWVGRFFAWFIFMPFTVFTELHRRHHAHLSDPKRDPDEWFYVAGKKWLFLRESLFMPRFIWLSLTNDFSAKVKGRVVRELLFNAISMGLVLHLLWINDLQMIVWLGFIFPMLILAIIINPISRGYEHFPLASMARSDPRRRDIRFNTVTVKNVVIGFLWANINYHVEHHLYPRVPFYRLPLLHRMLDGKSYIVKSFVLQSLD